MAIRARCCDSTMLTNHRDIVFRSTWDSEHSGVNSPIDVSKGRGGFAASVFLDVIELMRRLGMDVGTKVNAGLELTPFFPIQKKSRILFDAHVGLGF